MRTLVTLCLGLALLVPLPAQLLPDGFIVETFASGLSVPVSLAFLPDGRIVVAEQFSGNVKVLAGGSSAVVGTAPGVSPGGESGLLGIAVDPQWPLRPYLYAHYSHTSGDLRIAMLTVTGDLSNPQSTNLSGSAWYTVLDALPDLAPLHNGGTLRFGPDGTLYVSLGDDSIPCAAQDINLLQGKILRLDVSALPGGGAGPPPRSLLVPPGNPRWRHSSSGPTACGTCSGSTSIPRPANCSWRTWAATSSRSWITRRWEGSTSAGPGSRAARPR